MVKFAIKPISKFNKFHDWYLQWILEYDLHDVQFICWIEGQYWTECCCYCGLVYIFTMICLFVDYPKWNLQNHSPAAANKRVKIDKSIWRNKQPEIKLMPQTWNTMLSICFSDISILNLNLFILMKLFRCNANTQGKAVQNLWTVSCTHTQISMHINDFDNCIRYFPILSKMNAYKMQLIKWQG